MLLILTILLSLSKVDVMTLNIQFLFLSDFWTIFLGVMKSLWSLSFESWIITLTLVLIFMALGFLEKLGGN